MLISIISRTNARRPRSRSVRRSGRRGFSSARSRQAWTAMTRIGDTYAGRFLIWLAASAAILGITFVLLVWWMEQFPDRSDFHTNGRMWVVLTIEMIDLIPVPAFLLIVFCVAVPRWLAHEYRRGDGAPRIFPLVFTVALIEFALLAPLFWGSSERI